MVFLSFISNIKLVDLVQNCDKFHLYLKDECNYVDWKRSSVINQFNCCFYYPRAKCDGRLKFRFGCQSTGGRGYPHPVTGPAKGGGFKTRVAPTPEQVTSRVVRFLQFPAGGLSCFYYTFRNNQKKYVQ